MKKNLQQKMGLFLLLPVAVLLLFAWGVAFVFARNAVLGEWREGAVLKLQRAAHYVDMRLTKPIESIEMFHKTGGARDGAAIQRWILEELENMEGVSQVRLLWAEDAQGSAPMDHTGHNGHPMERIAEVTPPSYDTEAGQETVKLISGIKDPSGRSLGVLEVAVRFDYLLQDIRQMGWWQSDEACLVDDQGTYLAHSRMIPEERSRLGDSNQPLELALLEAMQVKHFGTVLGPGYPPREVGGFYRMKEAPWTMILMAPGEEALAPLLEFRSYFFAAGLLSVFLIIVLIRFVVGRIVSSIKDISRAAERIASGDYGSALPVDREDEIGQLRQSFNHMVDGLKERDFVKNTFGRYMDEGIARELLSRPEAIRMGGQKREVAILMSDIRNFTPLSESLSPERTLRVLNRYFSHMIDTIQKHRGIIVDFFGDAILVFFDPFDGPLAPTVQEAVDCALEMQKTMAEVNGENRAAGRFPELQMGIGVHAGEVIVGNIGSEARAKYGIVGTPVNLTQRMQSTAEAGEVIVSPRVIEIAGEGLCVKRSVCLRLKGIQDQVILHSVERRSQGSDSIDGPPTLPRCGKN